MPATAKRSALLEAFQKLNETPAVSICEETAVPRPDTRFVVDRSLATYAARTNEGFVFIPDQGTWQTYSILRSANSAWQHDQLPVLAVCAFSKSPAPMQRETGIQTDTVDQFLSDLALAHRIVPKLGASPSYIVRHYPRPHEVYDEVVLPAHTNLIVYQPHALSPAQLTRLFEHVAGVQGKVILCDDRSALANSHPELTDALEKSISRAVPHRLRQILEPPHPTDDDKRLPINIHGPAPLQNGSHAAGESETLDTSFFPRFDDPPKRNPYLIYHARTHNAAEFPSGYVLVAKIDADNIYRALADSQDFGAPWTENPGVTAFTHRPRSTQSGDVICHNGVVQRLGASDFEIVKNLEPKLDRSERPEPVSNAPEPDVPEPGRPRHKLKP